MIPGQPPMGGGIPTESNVDTLLSKWGLSFTAQPIADRRLLVQGQAPPRCFNSTTST